MSLLIPEELEKPTGAETRFPSPIPVQSPSSDEFMPAPQSAQQRDFETRVKAIGAKLAKRNAMTRRRFFQSAAGMAAAFVAMNETYAKTSAAVYDASPAEAADLTMAQARAILRSS